LVGLSVVLLVMFVMLVLPLLNGNRMPRSPSWFTSKIFWMARSAEGLKETFPKLP
jgi:hypothetical protein